MLTLEKTHTRGIIYTTIGGIFWGFSGVCGQFLFMNYRIDSAYLTVVRMTLAGAILVSLSLPRRKEALTGLLSNKKDALQLLAFSIAGLLLCQYAFLTAVQYTNSGTATVLQNLNVVILTIFLSLKHREFPPKIQVISIILALVGVYLIATNGNPYNMVLSPVGLFWGIVTASGVVSYTLLSQRIIKKWGNQVVTGSGMLLGGIVLFFLVQAWNIPVSLDFTAWVVIAVIILIGTVGAFSLFLQGVHYLGPVKATLIACLEPVTATMLSALWLHTGFSTVDIIGFCCILATVFLSVRG